MGQLFASPGSKNQNKKSNQNAKSSNITEKDRAILDLKNSRDKLKRFQKKLENDSVKLKEQAKQLVQSNQQKRALLVLKLKKHREIEADKIDGQLLTVMKMIDDIEWESTNMKVLEALKKGNEALNQLHQEMSVEDIEALLTETNEAIEVENQINAVLAGQVNLIDDAELESELNMLMAADASKQVTSIEDAKALPKAPVGKEVETVSDSTTDVSPQRQLLAS